MIQTRRIARIVRIRATIALAILFALASVFAPVLTHLLDSKLLLQSPNSANNQHYARTLPSKPIVPFHNSHLDEQHARGIPDLTKAKTPQCARHPHASNRLPAMVMPVKE